MDDHDEWEALRAAFKEVTGFDMGEMGGSHLFTFDIEGAAWQRLEGGTSWRTTSWNPRAGVREHGRDSQGQPIAM